MRVNLHSNHLSAALDPYPDANTPESVPLSESVLHVAQIALGQIFGPGREEREPRWRCACLGSVADLDPLRRRAAPYHITDELCNLVRRHPVPVCLRYSSRERQDLVHPCARKCRDMNGLRLQVGKACCNEPLYLPEPLWGYEISLVDHDPARGACFLYLAGDPEVACHDAVCGVHQQERDVG